MNSMAPSCAQKRHVVEVAAGRAPADLVLKNATFVNVFANDVDAGDIAIAEGLIAGVGSYSGPHEVDLAGRVVLPGFIDAHIHLESSLVAPGEFAKAVLPHGTTTVVTDPHEIANVMGVDGIEYMLQATEGLPLDVLFMLPSCVPATPLDESGAVLDSRAIEPLYAHPRVLGLAEVMNYPGVIAADAPVLEKIAAAQAHGGRVDGHAPGLAGNDLNAYIAAGIGSDHECSTLADALCKLRRGQVVMIREGTAAHNLEALAPLLCEKYADRCLFCCDDRHPLDLLEKGHIDHIVRTAVALGASPVAAVKAACYNPARYFGLDGRGAVAPGYAADLVVVDDLEHFGVLQVYKRGVAVYADGALRAFDPPAVASRLVERAHNTFRVARLTAADFAEEGRPRGVIGLVAGQIVSEDRGRAEGVDLERDVLKIAVVERHRGTGHVGIGYLQGYGLRSGAVATSVAHDAHNVIVVGANDEDMAAAANAVVANKGGIAVVDRGATRGEVALPIAGLMSDEALEQVNAALERAKTTAFDLGVSRGVDPFMTLSFMSLPVIPTLRLTTRGVVDVASQRYV